MSVAGPARLFFCLLLTLVDLGPIRGEEVVGWR